MKVLGNPVNDAEVLLEASLLRLPQYAPEGLHYAAISGGITNANYRVVSASPEAVLFVKIPGIGTEAFIDRKVANEAAVLASAVALGPRVLHFLSDTGVEVSEFVEGYRPCNNFDFQTKAVREMAIDCYRKFHAGNLLSQTKTVFDMIDEHVMQARVLGGISRKIGNGYIGNIGWPGSSSNTQAWTSLPALMTPCLATSCSMRRGIACC